MLQMASILLFAVLNSAQSERPTYEAAYRKAQEEKKPLLVIVGADWCPACKTLKSQTIEPMQSEGKLEEVVVTVVDKDSRPELAQQLMQGNSLPQLVIFAESNEGWKRFSLSGLQSENRVKELIQRATSEAVLPETASRSVIKR